MYTHARARTYTGTVCARMQGDAAVLVSVVECVLLGRLPTPACSFLWQIALAYLCCCFVKKRPAKSQLLKFHKVCFFSCMDQFNLKVVFRLFPLDGQGLEASASKPHVN